MRISVGSAQPILTSAPIMKLPRRTGNSRLSASSSSAERCTGSAGNSTLRSWPVGSAARIAASSKVRWTAIIAPAALEEEARGRWGKGRASSSVRISSIEKPLLPSGLRVVTSPIAWIVVPPRIARSMMPK